MMSLWLQLFARHPNGIVLCLGPVSAFIAPRFGRRMPFDLSRWINHALAPLTAGNYRRNCFGVGFLGDALPGASATVRSSLVIL